MHKVRKIELEILQSVNKRTQSLRETLRMVVIGIVINTLLGRLTLDPAGMHCPSWDEAFVSSLFVFCLSHSERRAFEGRIVVRTSIALLFIGQFRRDFQHFSKLIAVSEALLILCIRRYVVPQFCRNCGQKLRKVQKSAEKIVRTTSYRQLKDLKKNSTAVVQGRDCRCAPI